jgi:hypothetical protein
MKYLFISRHFTYFRNFDSVVERLAERGHDVHLAAEGEETRGRALVDRLAARYPGRVTVGLTPRVEGRRARLARSLRLGLDYLRYADPAYETTPAIRARASERAPAFARALGRGPGRGLAMRGIGGLEAAVSDPRVAEAFIAERAPDLMLLSPLIGLGSPQVEYLRAARRLGVPNALCVWSWDHLSSKALIRIVPDRVIVWNATQREEAVRFHDIDPARVIVTGAQCFDRWFDRGPSRSRQAFCRRAGLPDDRPYLLWVCSALFRGSPSEAAFVRQWIDAVRRSPDPRVREAAILVRPHPQRAEDWDSADWMRGLPGVSRWGGDPLDDESRADYYDSMHHSAAVVGLNTSALVEAAILDRPVYTVLTPAFRDNQEGTFHFHYLLTIGSGFLRATRDLDAHARSLAGAFDGSPSGNRQFVEAFIRPHGRPATDVFVEAVERLAAAPRPAPVRRGIGVALARPVASLLAATAELPGLRRVYWSPVRDAEERARAEMLATRRRRRRAEARTRRARVRARRVREARLRVGKAASGLNRARRRTLAHVKSGLKRLLVTSGVSR